MGQWRRPGAAGHLPKGAGFKCLQEALAFKATTPIPPSEEDTHGTCATGTTTKDFCSLKTWWEFMVASGIYKTSLLP